jgi:hypothetical protein
VLDATLSKHRAAQLTGHNLEARSVDLR